MSLTLHDAAAKKIKQIAEEDPDVKDYHKLRVFIQGGGCSGFQYGFMFDKEKDDGQVVAHKTFWQFPASNRTGCTITELIYVPNSIVDDLYFLNLHNLEMIMLKVIA